MNTINNIWKRFHQWISGAPNEYISFALIVTAIFGIIVALIGPPEFKALLLAYWWFP